MESFDDKDLNADDISCEDAHDINESILIHKDSTPSTLLGNNSNSNNGTPLMDSQEINLFSH